MPEPDEHEITRLLQRLRAGDPAALDELLPYVLDELKRLARRWLTTQHPSWQPTSLVNELFVRLLQGSNPDGPDWPDWHNRQHFFNAASQQMRHLMIDQARRKQAEKRGGGALRLPLDEALDAAAFVTRYEELLALHEALQAFEPLYPRPAQVVNLRFFAGLDEQETAQALGVCDRSVRRDWAFARAWLRDYLQSAAA